MEKTRFYILLFLFLVFLTSLCNSEDYKYDDYKYYDEKYDYDNQKPDDYTDDYSQKFIDDYYEHNLPNPPPVPSPPLPPPTPMSPFWGKITIFLFELYNMMKYRLFTLKSKQIKQISMSSKSISVLGYAVLKIHV